MSDTILRSKLIRLAHAQPDLRPKLLPLIQREARQMSTKSFDEWVKGKSFTNPETKNKVKFNSLPKEEQAKIRSGWESKNKGKSEGGKAKGLGELLDGWHDSASDPIYQVSSFARAGKPIKPEVAEKAIKKIKTLMTSATGEDKKDLGSALKELETLVKADGGDGAKEPPKAEADAAPKAEKPAKKPGKVKVVDNRNKKTYKKNYGKAIEKVLDAHKLTDADMDDVLEFKKDRPRKGKAVPPAELMRRFLENAKPETKERMKGMNPNDFVKLLGALFDEEEGGTGKTASADAALRSGLIRLAYQRPELRPKLLPLISKEAATPTYRDYVEKKRKSGEKPMDEAAWEAKVLGKAKKSDDKPVLMGDMSFAPAELADRRHEIYNAASDLHKSAGGWGKHSEVDKAFNALGFVLDDIKDAGKRNGGTGAEHAPALRKAYKALSDAVAKVSGAGKSK